MPKIQILGFKPEFGEHVLSGRKRHTIRTPREKNPINPGDTLHLYTGLRQAGAKLLIATVCTDVDSISISRRHCIITEHGASKGERLSAEHREIFAKRDGFASYAELVQFLGADTKTFKGVLIWWQSPEDLFADFIEEIAAAIEQRQEGKTPLRDLLANTLNQYSTHTIRQFEGQLAQLWATLEWHRRRIEGKPERKPKAKKKAAAPIAIDQARR